MDENWKIKKSLSNSIANHKLNEIYQEAKIVYSAWRKIIRCWWWRIFLFFCAQIIQKQKNFFQKKKYSKSEI